jgi:hypothetical protein
MDATSLESTYRAILDLAEHGSFGEPPAGEWGPALVLAHLAANDEVLLEAVRAVLAGVDDARYDNRPAVEEGRLRQYGDLPAVIDRLESSSHQLVDLASQLSDGQAAREIAVRIEDDGEVAVDGPLALGRLLDLHATVHLPSHLSQLEGLRVPS